MPRSENLKLAQKRYREKNREKHNAINLASRHRCYERTGRIYARKYYLKNRNYTGVDNMGKQLIILFQETL